MIHLHNHTEGSNMKYYDCVIQPKYLVAKAHSLGQKAIGITDHDSLCAIPDFVAECKKYNIKPIIGNEIYITRNGLSGETHEKGEKFAHFILLAKNRKGYAAINELSTYAWGNSYTKSIKRTPTHLEHFINIVKFNQGNLIGTTACLGGIVGHDILQYLSTNDAELKQNIVNKLTFFNNLFGQGNFYLEVQPALYKEQTQYNEFLLQLSQELDIPLTVACDVHYLEKDHFNLHHHFLNSQQKFSSHRETAAFYQYTYYMTDEEIKQNLSQCQGFTNEVINQCIQTTHDIADSIETFPIGYDTEYLMETTHRDTGWEEKLDELLPKYTSLMMEKYYNSKYEIDRYTLYQILINFEDKVARGWITQKQKAIERLEEELDTLWQVSETVAERMSKYFLTMKEMLAIVWRVSIVGVGRGSAGGSLISFLMEITSLNPLETYEDLELPFWRFLHPSRPELPDIDIDSSSSKKVEILENLQEWATNQNHQLVKVGTKSRLQTKNALQVAARGLGYEPEDVLFFSSVVPIKRGTPVSLDEAMEDKNFKNKLADHWQVVELAKKLEGIQVAQGSHAAAVCFINKNDMYQRCSYTIDDQGFLVTAFDLEELEKLKIAVKFDFLNTKAMDSIQTSMLLLQEHGYIEDQGSIKATYDKYFHPAVIDHTDPKIWETLNRQEVIGLFQWTSPAATQGLHHIQPQNLRELSDANSAIRLMPPVHEDGSQGELPTITFGRQKKNIRIWYAQMEEYGLSTDEQSILEEYLKDSAGMCIDQELIMRMSMDSRISSFSVKQANKLRKAIAKKKKGILEEVKEMFYTQGRQNRTSEQLLSYIWEECFMLSAGYGFSLIHSTLYSMIAIQQLYIVNNYPSIFWNTARILVESQSIDFLEFDAEDDEEELTNKPVNYFKLASAIAQTKDFGVKINPPNINKSNFTFKPDVEENAIYFGLKGISRLGDSKIQEIFNARPFTSLQDVLTKVKLEIRQIVMLVKAGALDEFGDRADLLYQVCKAQSNPKKRLTLQNINALINYNLLPEELKYEIDFIKIQNHLKKYFKAGDLYTPDSNMVEYINNYPIEIHQEQDGSYWIKQQEWKKYYDKVIKSSLKNYVNQHQDTLLQQLNNILLQEQLDKYYIGTTQEHEMEAISTYLSGHELSAEEYSTWLWQLGVCDFGDLNEEPTIQWQGKNGARTFELSRIAGVSVGRDKGKNLLGLLTPSGFVEVKINRNTFLKFDKQVKHENITEKSWFSKGEKLILTGYRKQDKFYCKVYKNTTTPAIAKIIRSGSLETNRINE